jgi:hypothetical protein
VALGGQAAEAGAEPLRALDVEAIPRVPNRARVDARQLPEQAVVVLRDGASLRGQVVEVIPGEQVTLRLAGGQVLRLDWSLLERIGEPAAPPTPFVEIDYRADDPNARLLRLGERTDWRGTAISEMEEVCRASCRRLLHRHEPLAVAGQGVVASRLFALPADAPSVRIRVETGSQTLRKTGWTLLGGGVAVAVVGAAVALVGVSSSPTMPAPITISGQKVFLGQERQDMTGGLLSTTQTGLVIAGVGAAAALACLPFVLLSKTHVVVAGDRKDAAARRLVGRIQPAPGGIVF